MSVQAIAWVMTYSRAYMGSRLVLLSIANHADVVGGSSWPSIRTMAREAGGMSERQVKRAIKELEALGEVEIVERGGGRNRSHRFRMTKIGDHAYEAESLSLYDRAETAEEGNSDTTSPFGTGTEKGDVHGSERVTSTTETVTPVVKKGDTMSPEPSGTVRTVPEPSSARDPSDVGKSDKVSPFRPKATTLPEDWKPNEADRQFALDRGFSEPEIDDIAAEFLGYWTAGGGRTKTHTMWSETTRNGRGGHTAWQSRVVMLKPKSRPADKSTRPHRIGGRPSGSYIWQGSKRIPI